MKFTKIIFVTIIFLNITGCSKTIYMVNEKKVDNNEINLTGHNLIIGLFKKSKVVELNGWLIKIDSNDEIVEVSFKDSIQYTYYRNSKFVFEVSESRYTGNVFQALATTKNTLYAITVYYDADPDSFEPFMENTNYTKDKDQVFFKTKPIPGAAPDSFKVFNAGNLEDLGFDINYVYIKENKVKKSHSPTFVQLNNNYSKDRNLIYYHMAEKTIAIEGSDGSSVQLISDSSYYLKDIDSVYYLGVSIPDVDAVSFRLVKGINEYFGKDETSVYFEGIKLDGADPGTFIDLDYHYGKDKTTVYYEEKEIEGSDPSSFVVKSGRESFDKNNHYIYGVISNDQ